jgi:ferredoxin
MALEIVDSCVNCWACQPLCPKQAIQAATPHFLIEADKCTECSGDFAARSAPASARSKARSSMNSAKHSTHRDR